MSPSSRLLQSAMTSDQAAPAAQLSTTPAQSRRGLVTHGCTVCCECEKSYQLVPGVIWAVHGMLTCKAATKTGRHTSLTAGICMQHS